MLKAGMIVRHRFSERIGKLVHRHTNNFDTLVWKVELIEERHAVFWHPDSIIQIPNTNEEGVLFALNKTDVF